jgi:EAL domain-containing protein (putative c-di-GMP-specific phosphodiesterase class I)
MNDHAHVVIIGLDTYADSWLSPLHYAEKDGRNLFAVLTAPEFGNVPLVNAQLALGAEATTRKVEELLYKHVVKERTRDDTVLVYFAGYGFFAGEPEKAYLGTHDVSLTALETNPNAGLRLDWLCAEICQASKAKHVLFWLDGCFKRVFHAARTNERAARLRRRDVIGEQFDALGKGRVALVACAPETATRENSSLQNGVFTHYLLRGLQGEASEANGDVTFDSLAAYVRQHTPTTHVPARYGQNFGRIVLTRPHARPKQSEHREAINRKAALLDATSSSLAPLQNPLEPFRAFVQRLMAQLGEQQPATPYVETRILEAVRDASAAEFAFVLRVEQHDWVVKAQSSFIAEHGSISTYLEAVDGSVWATRVRQTIFSEAHHGVYQVYANGSGTDKAIVIVPLPTDPTHEFLVVCGLPNGSPWVSDVYARILSTVYVATRELTWLHPTLLEASILDDLKRTYGFMPLALYERRLELFRERLQHMVVHFEPVLYLEPSALHIESWEALARDPDHMRSPLDLFHAAELWGSRFMVTLDKHFIELATTSYNKALDGSGRRRAEQMLDLSVNVYPESLVKSAYFDAIKHITHVDKLIQPKKLFLEISEKSPIPDNGHGAQASSQEFRARLATYVRECEIGFALDDFGVGHASVSRLASLHPSIVKIDRDLLQVEFADDSIRFALNLVKDIVSKQGLRAPKIILEGVDNLSPITLHRLYKLGVRHVQGHIVDHAGPDLNRLSKEQYARLIKLITGVDTD